MVDSNGSQEKLEELNQEIAALRVSEASLQQKIKSLEETSEEVGALQAELLKLREELKNQEANEKVGKAICTLQKLNSF